MDKDSENATTQDGPANGTEGLDSSAKVILGLGALGSAVFAVLLGWGGIRLSLFVLRTLAEW